MTAGKRLPGLLFSREWIITMAETRLHEDTVLAGRMKFLSLGEILQMLGANGCTGVMHLSSPFAPEPGRIYFSKGQPINAECLSQNGQDALQALFGWLDGEFTFVESEVSGPRAINQGLMEIIMDGARLLDDGHIKVLSAETAPELLGSVEKKPLAKPAARPKLKGIPIIRQPLRNQKFVREEQEFSSGEPIVNQGKLGAWLCVILQGFANVYKDSGKGKVRLCRLGPGALIGNVPTFMNYKYQKSMSITAAGQVKVGVFDMQNLMSDFANISNTMRNLALSLDRRFGELTERVAEADQGRLDLQPFVHMRRPILRQGVKENRAYVIKDGIATVLRKIGDGYVPLCRLGKGDFVGHVPFVNIGHEPNAAGIVGSRNFKLEKIDTDALHKEYDRVSPLVRQFMEHMATCVSVTTMVACDVTEPAPLEAPAVARGA